MCASVEAHGSPHPPGLVGVMGYTCGWELGTDKLEEKRGIDFGFF